MSYVVFLNFDCLGVKLLNLPVPANNQTDTVQISINSATALLLLWHIVLCGLISTAPFLTEKKIAQCKQNSRTLQTRENLTVKRVHITSKRITRCKQDSPALQTRKKLKAAFTNYRSFEN